MAKLLLRTDLRAAARFASRRGPAIRRARRVRNDAAVTNSCLVVCHVRDEGAAAGL